MHRLISLIPFVLLICSLLGFNNAAAESDDESTLTSDTFKVTSGVEVKPLDHEDNPYRGEYREWDEWIYANARSRPIAWKDSGVPDSWGVLPGYVGDDGFLLPQHEFTRMRREAWKNGSIDEFHEDYFQIYGEGEVPQELATGYSVCMDEIIASYFPAIPAWLADTPPHSAMLLPDGNIVTHGALAEEIAEENPEPCCGAYDYYLYSAEGVQLKTVRKDSTWWMLYFDTKEHGWPEGEFANRRDGYFYFTNPLNGQILSIWDYTGTRLTTTVQPPVRDAHNFIWIRRAQILDYYAHQND